MSKQIPKYLTTNAISSLLEGESDSQNVIVQLLNIQEKPKYNLCIVSDGSYSVEALISLDIKINPQKHTNHIIRILSHSSYGKRIAITTLDVILDYQDIIGNPINYFQAIQKHIQNKCSNKIDYYVKNQSNQKYEIKQQNYTKIQHTDKRNVISEKKQNKTNTVLKPTETNRQFQSSSNQTISSLYVGVSNWMILCRVLKSDYREYINKKGQTTKQLNIELIDRSEMRINGKFFGDSAEKNKDYIKENSVYQISKGRVVEGNYNDSKNKIYSPYSIVFNDGSVFNEVSDVNLIAKAQSLVVNLGTIVDSRLVNHELDIVAILLQIKQQIEIPKKDNSGMLKKRNLLICDPERQISMFACVWNNAVNVDPSMIGKTILLSKFKVNLYMDSLSLNSTPTSLIRLLDNHKYTKFQGKTNFQNYEMLSVIKKQNQNISGQTCRTTLELEHAIRMMNIGDVIRSELDVYVSRIATRRKWYYQGCTRCNRSLEPMSKCQKCNIIVETTAPHFNVGIQLSDSFGSFWTQAMDELALRIFDVNITELKKLSEDALADEADKYLYKQFRLRINTKKDQQNRIKHNVQKIFQMSYNKMAQNSLQMIKSLV